MNFAKLPMTSNAKKTIGVLSVITIALAAAVIIYLLIKRMANKEFYLLQTNAENDRVFWKGKTELQKEVSAKLVEYWKLSGINFSESQMQATTTHASYPWSAAYISSLVSRSGFKNFTARTTHASYVVDAKLNRKEKKTPAYWAFSPSEAKKVEIGDILVVNRAGSSVNLNNITRSTKTHGDIVVGFKKKDGKLFAEIQGGNVSNTVMLRLAELKNNYTLAKPTEYITQLKYVKNV